MAAFTEQEIREAVTAEEPMAKARALTLARLCGTPPVIVEALHGEWARAVAVELDDDAEEWAVNRTTRASGRAAYIANRIRETSDPAQLYEPFLYPENYTAPPTESREVEAVIIVQEAGIMEYHEWRDGLQAEAREWLAEAAER